MHGGVLTQLLPLGTKIIGCADNIALTVTGDGVKKSEMLSTDTVYMSDEWMRAIRRQIAHAKTEFRLVSSRRKAQKAAIWMGSTQIELVRGLKYLDVTIDDRLKFRNHLERVSKKAMKTANASAFLFA